MSWPVWVVVALLGGVGANARFLVHSFVLARSPAGFPLATLVVNLSGSLLLGLITGLALSGDALVLAGSATLGSYTTFSTWMLETHRLVEQRRPALAALNVIASLAFGIAAVALGRTIGAHI